MRKQKQMRMDEVTEVSGGDLKCSKHLASLRLRTGEAGLRVDFISHMKRVLQLSKLSTGSCSRKRSTFHSSVTSLPSFLSL